MTHSAFCSEGPRYTGKERDTESGNDYFQARYYASNIGRFMSPDPSELSYADMTNPQSLNLYSYTMNNPLSFTDPTGLYCYYGNTDYGSEQGQSDQDDTTQWDFQSNSRECSKNGGLWTSDAYTHTNWFGTSYDNQGRDEVPVSAISDASPQAQVTYTMTGTVPCPLCLDPNYNYNDPPKYTIGPRQITDPPPPPGNFECAVTPTEAIEQHAVAMQIWRKENLLPASAPSPSDNSDGGEGVSGTYLTTVNRTFFEGNKPFKLKPSPLDTAPNANIQGAAGANFAAMAGQYAISASTCYVTK